MCLSFDISDWKTTPRFFTELFGQIILESILMLQFGLLKCFGLKRRYFVLFGLTDNLFATRLVVLESGLELETGLELESVFAGLGLGLRLGSKKLGFGLRLGTIGL